MLLKVEVWNDAEHAWNAIRTAFDADRAKQIAKQVEKRTGARVRIVLKSKAPRR